MVISIAEIERLGVGLVLICRRVRHDDDMPPARNASIHSEGGRLVWLSAGSDQKAAAIAARPKRTRSIACSLALLSRPSIGAILLFFQFKSIKS